MAEALQVGVFIVRFPDLRKLLVCFKYYYKNWIGLQSRPPVGRSQTLFKECLCLTLILVHRYYLHSNR
ncbi:hypothetical protein BH11PSE12_BH11PSE12_34090 [soil metagenome]